MLSERCECLTYEYEQPLQLDAMQLMVFENDDHILWSVFMTGSKTPDMSDKEDVFHYTTLTLENIKL